MQAIYRNMYRDYYDTYLSMRLTGYGQGEILRGNCKSIIRYVMDGINSCTILKKKKIKQN